MSTPGPTDAVSTLSATDAVSTQGPTDAVSTLVSTDAVPTPGMEFCLNVSVYVIIVTNVMNLYCDRLYLDKTINHTNYFSNSK